MRREPDTKQRDRGRSTMMDHLVRQPHPETIPSAPWGAATWRKEGRAGTPHFLEASQLKCLRGLGGCGRPLP